MDFVSSTLFSQLLMLSFTSYHTQEAIAIVLFFFRTVHIVETAARLVLPAHPVHVVQSLLLLLSSQAVHVVDPAGDIVNIG